MWFDIAVLSVGYFCNLHFVSVSYTDLSSSVLRTRAIEFCFFGFACQVFCFIVRFRGLPYASVDDWLLSVSQRFHWSC